MQNQPIANTAALVAACDELGVKYSFYDDNRNLVGVLLDREYMFANCATPFNDESIGKIFKDKEFTYNVVRHAIRMPRTLGFVDPDCNPDYRSYVRLSTHDEICTCIENDMQYPVMIKMNSGSRGTNVFKCTSRSMITNAIARVFDKSSHIYDYVAIAQKYISIVREFRVIVFQSKIELVYEKDFSKAVLKDNLSPFHQENSKAVLISDPVLIERLSRFCAQLFKKVRIGFAGLDIAIDSRGDMFLIEINSKPGFAYFVRDNGMAALVQLYKTMLLHLPLINHRRMC